MQTTFTKQSDVDADWFIISGKDQVLGRLAVRIAIILMGKHKASFTPHVDDGDYVIVTDAAEIVLTGRKEEQKVYRYHTGYVGGLKEIPYSRMRSEKSEQMIKLAVRRMLPKNRLGREMLSKLKVYAGSSHPHAAQQPKPMP
ncbi:MAG: 50S ribosomal protein L13 [Planctomycetota bacterium]|jgi:large subunit ribosomal protein L13